MKTNLMMFIDDDNVCPEDMCEQLFGFMDQLDHPEASLVAPVQYDDTKSVVRLALAKGFSFVFSRPQWLDDELTQSSDRYLPLMLASSNCLA